MCVSPRLFSLAQKRKNTRHSEPKVKGLLAEPYESFRRRALEVLFRTIGFFGVLVQSDVASVGILGSVVCGQYGVSLLYGAVAPLLC